jgi:hypothetical protein
VRRREISFVAAVEDLRATSSSAASYSKMFATDLVHCASLPTDNVSVSPSG